MNTELFFSIVDATTLNELQTAAVGVLTEPISKFNTIPSIRQEMLSLFEKIASVSAVFEKKNGTYAKFISEFPIPGLVAAAEFTLAELPNSSLPIMAEIQEKYTFAANDEIEDLENLMIALQTLEIAISGKAPAISESRAKEIIYVLGSANNPTPETPTEPAEPSGFGIAMDHTQVETPTINEYSKYSDDADFSQLMEWVFGHANKVEESYKVLKDTLRTKKKKDSKKALDCIFFASSYLNLVKLVDNYAPQFAAYDLSRNALRFRKFSAERVEKEKKFTAIINEIYELIPNLKFIAKQIDEGNSYTAPFDNTSNEYHLIRVESENDRAMDEHYNTIQRYEGIGDKKCEAYLDAALIYDFIRKTKSEKKYDNSVAGIYTIYTYGPFDGLDCKDECIIDLVQYFFTAYKKGGGTYKRCIANLFYNYGESFTFDHLKGMEEYMLKLGNYENRQAICAFLELMQNLEYTKGFKAKKISRMIKALKNTKKTDAYDKKTRKISNIIYIVYMAAIAILCPILLNIPSDIRVTGVITLAIMVVTIIVQLVAMKFATEFEKVFLIVAPISTFVALIVHYLVAFGFTFSFENFVLWPGSRGTIFGISFTATLMILLPCCFLSFTTYNKISYWAKSTVHIQPFKVIFYILFIFAARLLSDYLHMNILQSNLGTFLRIVTYLFSAAISVLPIYILLMNAKASNLFNRDSSLMVLILSIITAVCAVMMGFIFYTPFMHENVVGFTTDTIFRMFNIQALIMIIYSVLLNCYKKIK